MKTTTLMGKACAVALLFSMALFHSCKDDDAPKVFGVVSAKMIAGDGRSYNCAVEGETIINSADSMKMGTDLSTISLELEASMGTEMFYNNAALTKETVLDLTQPATIEARNGNDKKLYRVEAVVQTAQGAKVTSDMTATGLPKFNSYDIVSFKGKFYCIGADVADKKPESLTYYQVYSSEDGETWTKVNTNPKVIGGLGTRLVVLNNTLFAFGGYRYGTDEDGEVHSREGWMGVEPISTAWSVWTTTDGTTWTYMGWESKWSSAEGRLILTNLVTGEEEKEYVNQPSGRMYPNLCIHDGKICMNGGNMFGFGMFQSVNENYLWTTTDGKAWEKVLPEGEARPYRNAGALFSFNGKLWVIGGANSIIDAEGMKKDVWSSADGGANWVQEVEDMTADAMNGFTPRWGAKVAEHNGVLYMVGGAGFDGEGAQVLMNGILRSTDGKTWTALSAEEQLKDFEGRVNPILVNGDGSLLWIFGGVKEYTGNYGEPTAMLYDVWQKVIR